MLRPGDTLVIGPGTYRMNASLLIPSHVTVRGTAGKTILLKSRGVESALTEDGDFGESYLTVANPESFSLAWAWKFQTTRSKRVGTFPFRKS
jgi:hypothetical protein